MIFRIIVLGFVYSITYAQCIIYYNETPLTMTNQDAVGLLLEKERTCPQSIQQVNQLLQDNQFHSKTTMVANRGKNNASLGSFSFFSSISGISLDGLQIYPGEFYLGHFTTLEQDEIQLDQSPEKNKLLIELIAWDKKKQWFNFYELRGLDFNNTRWFYRGNSKDALLDNQYLHRDNPSNTPKFGNRMRCSACHNSGGPILKEMQAPHNDWWDTTNPLIFLPNHPDAQINALVNTLVDATQFTHEVRAGIKRLNRSARFKKLTHSLTLQEQLRPLFCTNEINLESNSTPGLNGPIHIPSGFWLNSLLGELKVVVPEKTYQRLLLTNKMQFPETQLNDADHAWLTPVKGASDILAIKQLIKNKIITRQFVQSVLMIDYSHPVFSKPRCELLKLVPLHAEFDWLSTFVNQLNQVQVKQPDALLLATYLSNSQKYNGAYFQQILSDYKKDSNSKINDNRDVQAIFAQLLETREEVFTNELSQNPLGQILEPGFRVIFPVPIYR